MTTTNVLRRRVPARVALVLAAASVAVLFAACDDGTEPPLAGGRYVATLEAPSGHTNGAALIEFTGSGIDTITAIDADVFMQRAGEVVRVAVVAEQPGTLRFAVQMRPDSNTPRMAVQEVSDANDALRGSLRGYAVRLRQ